MSAANTSLGNHSPPEVLVLSCRPSYTVLLGNAAKPKKEKGAVTRGAAWQQGRGKLPWKPPFGFFTYTFGQFNATCIQSASGASQTWLLRGHWAAWQKMLAGKPFDRPVLCVIYSLLLLIT